jgi:Tol biopolymer transport system component
MTLSPGSRLGPYEILAPLGAGGMGEVYRAKDPRLGREVAIKVLPASFSQDADRLRRFEQEAKAAGVLNHPNITAVYDIGSHESAPYVVQELLEGETLRSVLAAGRLSPRKAIDYGLQITHGLAAAHEKGIVHRDLKPDNIFVTNDGRVKILDFGLAKLVQRDESGPATSVPTATAGTEPGVVMGTLGYMSPEQVRGKPADARSDIFAFGAILYEMLAGRRAFQGGSAADTMSAILKEDPPDLSVTNQNVSPGLERIVRHCLEKNPEQRFHSAHDVAFDLETVSTASGALPAGTSAGRRSRRRVLAIAGSVLAALALALVAFWAGRRATAGAGAHVSSERFARTRLTFRRGNVLSARFTADSQNVVYAAAWGDRPTEIYLSRVGSPETRPLGISGANLLGVSSTGELAILLKKSNLFGVTGSGTLARVPLAGGAPRQIAEDVVVADWMPDGNNLAVARESDGRVVVEFPLGKPVSSATNVIALRVSPDGKRVAFIESDQTQSWITVIDAAGNKKELAKDFIFVDGMAWHPSGRELWFDGVNAQFGLGIFAGTPGGAVRLVTPTTDLTPVHDLAPDGGALVEREISLNEVLGRFPGDDRERNLSWLDRSNVAALSPDGKSILLTEVGEGGGPSGSVYLRSTDGSPAARLGDGQASDLSPDQKWALTIAPSGSGVKVSMLPTGAGSPIPVPLEGNLRTVAAFFLPPGGKRLLIGASEPGHGVRGYVVDRAGGKPRAFTPDLSGGGAVSPDGQSAALLGPDRRPIICPIAGGEPRPVAGLERDETPIQWSADGEDLFVARYGEAPLPVYRLRLKTGKKELWKELMPADRTGFVRIENVVVARDGAFYAYTSTRVIASDLFLLDFGKKGR